MTTPADPKGHETKRRRGLRRWGRISERPRPAWWGAAIAVAVGTAAIVTWNYLDQLVPGTGGVLATQALLNLAIAAGAAAVLTGLLFVTVGRFAALPWWYVWTSVTCVVLLVTLGTGASLTAWLAAAAVLFVGGSLLGAAVGGLLPHSGRRPVSLRDARVVMPAVAVVILLVPAVWLTTATQGPPTGPDVAPVPSAVKDDPAAPGGFRTGFLTYGSGSDRREEYGESADLRSTPVDGSRILKGWNADRRELWGFDADALPVNGMVWYPKGDGPFPLVLIAHGNKSSATESEAGYRYLAELLASHGFIVASVDQNFLNTGPLDRSGGLTGANIARGWLLLEHLRAWREWNEDPDSGFAGKVNLDDVGLVGHSRGGEAIAVAAHLQTLDRLPEDHSVTLDYDFGIRSLLAFAPSDGQYRPDDAPITLTDVNYLTVQGSHDADVTGFEGLDQYERISFTGREPAVKSALFVERANHGQFNTRWGNRDVGNGLPKHFIDTGALLAAEEQRRVAQVYAVSFLRGTLTDDTRLLDVLRDPRAAADWLPDTGYVSQFRDSGMTSAEESAVIPQGFTAAETIPLQLRNGPGEDEVRSLTWESGTAAALAVETAPEPEATHVVFDAVAMTGDDALADAITVELTDDSGDRATVPPEMPLPHLVNGQYLKAAWMHTDPLTAPVLQTHRIPLTAFTDANPEFDPSRVVTVTLSFDDSVGGTVLVDDVGLNTTP
ncbi:chlorophyllase-like protein [Stackebrandtia albiflava]|uniref:Chlorophyllase-like protein n=1 Tax=Stackebrandtia albiflava TaxID=406432 RepID=A0A562V2C1_9ACTN|nr:chlorophyllase-like protein [Stackebrandtia albiflava]